MSSTRPVPKENGSNKDRLADQKEIANEKETCRRKAADTCRGFVFELHHAQGKYVRFLQNGSLT
jgi:hypothetical protein